MIANSSGDSIQAALHLSSNMVSPQDLTAFQHIVQDALQNVEFINKVWIAGAAVAVSLFAALVASITQMLIARWQRKTQLRLAEQQAQQQKQALSEQLSMQELASRRIANANISAKRQVWIDELRKDIAKYLALWQDISYRWGAIVSKPRKEAASDEELDAFSRPIAEMRREAHELQMRIELRLNMIEDKHQELKTLMRKLEASTVLYQRTASQFPPEAIQAEFKKISQHIITKTQEILKEEWDRVKEESYADPNDSTYVRGART
ncbi:hypothetical protein ACW9FB_11895 [Ralstonia mannitolilytica]|uniref:hypothetical protein n=1 Tax=Cupriavidus metallidurans TaxID=119219 RepID=UPI003D0086B9